MWLHIAGMKENKLLCTEEDGTLHRERKADPRNTGHQEGTEFSSVKSQ
jgi:hypothetical protein